MATWKSTLKLFARRLVIALGVTALFVIFSTFPGLGYYGEAQTNVRSENEWGFMVVDAKCNISYDPFLYPLSWATGNGYYSGSFTFGSVPTYAGGGESWFPVWRMPKDLEDEAILTKITGEIVTNVLYVFLILLAMVLVIGWSSYFYFVGGLAGFSIAGFWGAIIGFFTGALILIFAWPRLKKSESMHAASDAWENLLSRLP